MIDLDKIEDLNRLFRLFTKVPTGLPTLRRALKDSVLRRGKDINQSSIATDVAEDIDIDVDDADATTTGPKGKGKGKARAPPQTLTLALKWVQDVLDLKDRFDRLWKQAFQSNREVESALNEVCTRYQLFAHANVAVIAKAFEDFVNLNEKAPEFMSLFIDENLKKGLKGVRRHRALRFTAIHYF